MLCRMLFKILNLVITDNKLCLSIRSTISQFQFFFSFFLMLAAPGAPMFIKIKLFINMSSLINILLKETYNETNFGKT